MARLYDPACYDLAVHFLCDDHAEESDRACLDELSQLIQNTIEGFLSTHECRNAYDAPVFDGGKHYLPDVRSDVPRPVCVCSSDEFARVPCPVHGRS